MVSSMDSSSVENPPLQVAARALASRIEANGFNGIWFTQSRVANACSLQDFVDDGFPPSNYYEHIRTNVGMILEPAFPPLVDAVDLGGGEYVALSFDTERFYDDLEREVVRVLSRVGRIESISINRNTHEVYVAMSEGVPA